MTQQYLPQEINNLARTTAFTNTGPGPDITLTGRGDQVLLFDATAAAGVVTLPPSGDAGVGAKVVVIKTAGAAPNTVTFAFAGGDAPAAPAAITPLTLTNAGESYTFITDGDGTWAAVDSNF